MNNIIWLLHMQLAIFRLENDYQMLLEYIQVEQVFTSQAG